MFKMSQSRLKSRTPLICIQTTNPQQIISTWIELQQQQPEQATIQTNSATLFNPHNQLSSHRQQVDLWQLAKYTAYGDL